MRSAVIVDVVRTPSGKGKPGGVLSGLHPVELLTTVLTALIERTDIDPGLIDDVIAGCVGQAREQAVNIGRQGVLAAGWPESVPATTIDRQCGSSQQAVHFAAQGVLAGSYDIAVACGVESMSRVPIGVSTMGEDPFGARIQARYSPGLVNQGVSAELVAQRWGLEKDEMNAFAAQSHSRAAAAADAGDFDSEIVAVKTESDDGTSVLVDRDETVRAQTTLESLSSLRPSFRTDEMAARFPNIDWRITPGNSSPLTDGASAVLVVEESVAERLGLTPRARVHSMAVAGDDPVMMLTAPIPATRKVLERVGLTIDDMDSYEVNEAFAPVPLAWAREFGADPARLNPRGGAIALGHPLGASGARLLATMINYLESTGGRYGLQTMCEGGGMANATVIERL